MSEIKEKENPQVTIIQLQERTIRAYEFSSLIRNDVAVVHNDIKEFRNEIKLLKDSMERIEKMLETLSKED